MFILLPAWTIVCLSLLSFILFWAGIFQCFLFFPCLHFLIKLSCTNKTMLERMVLHACLCWVFALSLKEIGVRSGCSYSSLFWPLWKWPFSYFQPSLTWLCKFFSSLLILGSHIGGDWHIWAVKGQFKPVRKGGGGREGRVCVYALFLCFSWLLVA